MLVTVGAGPVARVLRVGVPTHCRGRSLGRSGIEPYRTRAPGVEGWRFVRRAARSATAQDQTRPTLVCRIRNPTKAPPAVAAAAAASEGLTARGRPACSIYARTLSIFPSVSGKLHADTTLHLPGPAYQYTVLVQQLPSRLHRIPGKMALPKRIIKETERLMSEPYVVGPSTPALASFRADPTPRLPKCARHQRGPPRRQPAVFRCRNPRPVRLAVRG